MSSSATLGLPCRFIVGIHEHGVWKGFEMPCGRTRGTMKDPRSERYDDGLCPTHWQVVFAEPKDDRT
jgi:hypothetical protein